MSIYYISFEVGMPIKLYPDETIYSFCARIHASSGDTSVIRTLDRLFEKKSDTTNTIWKTGISQLATYIGVDVSELLDKHSFYPYFRKFCSKDKEKELKDVLLYGDGNPSKLIGLNLRFSNSALYLCPNCAGEDTQKYGEPYWHRSHQLPGSLVCYKHNVRLIKGCNSCDAQFTSSKNLCFTITPLICSNGHFLDSITNDSLSLLTLARENDYILNTSLAFSLEEVQEKIRKFARLQGYLNVNSSVVKYNKVYSDLLKLYPQHILEEIDEHIIDRDDNWLRSVFWNSKMCSKFPPHYVMVMIFLRNSVQSFIQDNADFHLFGSGPWECKNIICLNFDSKIITGISYTESKKFIVGTFQCPHCKFSYTRHSRLNDFDEEDVMKVQTIKETGPLWDEKLEELLQRKDIMYLNSIAKELNVSSRILLTRLKNRFSHLDFVKSKQTDTRIIQRNKISGIIADNPKLTRAEVKEKCRPAFQWLIKNDKEWLNDLLPPHRQPITLEQRREKMLSCVANNPGLTRNELKKIDVTTYEWLVSNDYDWINSVLPAIRSKRVYQKNCSLEYRRGAYLQLREKYPDYSQTEIINLDTSNYQWLKMYDSDWLGQHQPPRKKGKTRHSKQSIDERRAAFISILESNPHALRKDLKRMCGNNYIYLERRDTEWFRKYQPLIRIQVNTAGRHMSKEQRRELFLEIRNQSPQMSRSQLKSLNNANYSWLLKNDKSWLHENTPPIRTRSKNN